VQEASGERARAGSLQGEEEGMSRITMGLAIVGFLVAVMLMLLFVRILAFLGG